MPQRHRRPPPKFPFHVDCFQCDSALLVYAVDSAAADIKIAARGWKRNPYRCLRCVTVHDQQRTGVLDARA